MDDVFKLLPSNEAFRGRTTMQFIYFFKLVTFKANLRGFFLMQVNGQKVFEARSEFQSDAVTRASASSMEIMFSFTIIISWMRSSSLMVISLATKPTSSPWEVKTEIKTNVTSS